MDTVNEILKDIKSNLSQVNASQKDETRVMRAMLNDRTYEVGIYGKEGQTGTFCPAKEARVMIASVMSSAAKIPQAEAEALADKHEFKKSEATIMVDISKEFVMNTYLESGRKISLGGRTTSDVSLSRKHVDAHVAHYPKQIGFDSNGKAKYGPGEAHVKAHDTVKVHSSCPAWVK